MNKFKEYGYVEDDNNSEFNRILSNNNLNEVHIDVYSGDEYMLFARMVNNNVDSNIRNNRIVLKKNRTVIMNLLLKNIKRCMIKKYNDSCQEFVFMVRDIWYKMFVVI